MIKKLRMAIKSGKHRIKVIRENNRKRRATVKHLVAEHESTVMYDSVTVSNIPNEAPAVAGYVDGFYKTFPYLLRDFPHAWKMPIAVFHTDDASCLDIEMGDATNSEASAWVKRQIKRGLKKPVIYTSASNVDTLLAVLKLNGIHRSEVRLWSAHYTFKPHLCGPHSCGETDTIVDATQWTDTALGRSLDQSLLRKHFFQVK